MIRRPIMQRRENEAANPSSEASSFPLVDFISKVSDKMSYKEFKKNIFDICRYILQILLVYPLDCTKCNSSVQAQMTCANSTITLQCTDISQFCAIPKFLQLGVPQLCSALLSYRLSEHSFVHAMIAYSSVH